MVNFDGTAHNSGSGQVFEVPLVQEVGVRNRIVEVPEIHVVEKVQPKIRIQEIVRRVPKIEKIVQERIVEVPQVEIVEKIVYVPQVQEVIKHVPKIEVREITREIPKEVVRYVEKTVEVPEIHVVEKIVEVPQIQYVVKEVAKVEIVDIPVEVIRHIPRKEIQKIEKVRHVPGPIQLIDLPYDVPVPHEVFDIVEKVVEVPVDQEFIVEKPVARTVPGPVIDVPYEVTKVEEKIIYQDVPGQVLTKEIPYDVEQVEEVQVPEYHEVIRVVPRVRLVPVERIHEIEVPHYEDEFVEVPSYVYVQEKPVIIQPKPVQEIRQLPDVWETEEPRVIYDPPQQLPAIYERMEDAVVESRCPKSDVYIPPAIADFTPRPSGPNKTSEGCGSLTRMLTSPTNGNLASISSTFQDSVVIDGKPFPAQSCHLPAPFSGYCQALPTGGMHVLPANNQMPSTLNSSARSSLQPKFADQIPGAQLSHHNRFTSSHPATQHFPNYVSTSQPPFFRCQPPVPANLYFPRFSNEILNRNQTRVLQVNSGDATWRHAPSSSSLEVLFSERDIASHPQASHRDSAVFSTPVSHRNSPKHAAFALHNNMLVTNIPVNAAPVQSLAAQSDAIMMNSTYPPSLPTSPANHESKHFQQPASPMEFAVFPSPSDGRQHTDMTTEIKSPVLAPWPLQTTSPNAAVGTSVDLSKSATPNKIVSRNIFPNGVNTETTAHAVKQSAYLISTQSGMTTTSAATSLVTDDAGICRTHTGESHRRERREEAFGCHGDTDMHFVTAS